VEVVGSNPATPTFSTKKLLIFKGFIVLKNNKSGGRITQGVTATPILLKQDSSLKDLGFYF